MGETNCTVCRQLKLFENNSPVGRKVKPSISESMSDHSYDYPQGEFVNLIKGGGCLFLTIKRLITLGGTYIAKHISNSHV